MTQAIEKLTPASGAPYHWHTRHGVGSKDDAPHGEVIAALQRCRDRAGYRRAADRLYLRMFDDVRYVGFGEAGVVDSPEAVLKNRLRENVIRAIGKTAHSKLLRQKLRPKPITEGGNFYAQSNAELLDKWLGGMFDSLKADALFSKQRLHGIAVGTGCVYVDHDGTQIIAEVAPSWELDADASEAKYGAPPNLYRSRTMDRLGLLAKFPEFEAEIAALTVEKGGDRVAINPDWDDDTSGDMVAVYQAWHLPSSEDADDGRYVMCAQGVTFVNEQYSRDHFPFSFFRWSERASGLWGAGLVEDLVGQQIEYDNTLMRRQEAMRLLSAPYVLIEKGSKIVKAHFSNQIGRILEYVGVKPEVTAPEPISSAMLEHGDRVKQGMFEQARINQMSVWGEKPQGLNSGKALRTYADMEAEGLIEAIRNAENSVIEFAELLIEAAVDLDTRRAELEKAGERLPKLSTDFVGDDGIEKIDWSDIDLERDKFVLKIAPVSALSTTVSGKFQDLQDLRDLGIVTDPAEMRELLGMPDLKQSANRQLAHRRLILRVLEVEILKKGIYWQPEPTWDLNLALRLAVDTLLDAELRGAPEPKQEMLRKFILAVQDMLGVAQPTPALNGAVEPSPLDPTTGLPVAPGVPMASAMPPMAGAPMPSADGSMPMGAAAPPPIPAA